MRINSEPAKGWRINMMPAGDGNVYLYLHGDVRKASGTALGDRVRVEIDFDPSYRNGSQHPMPRWFRQALAGNPQALKNWTALIPFERQHPSAALSRDSRRSFSARSRSHSRTSAVSRRSCPECGKEFLIQNDVPRKTDSKKPSGSVKPVRAVKRAKSR